MRLRLLYIIIACLAALPQGALAQAVPHDSLDISLERTEVLTDAELYRRDSLKHAQDSLLFLGVPKELLEADSIALAAAEPWDERFNPDPTRALWMSALFPGLGQVYNRRYWKLPIIAGGFVGLAYAITWNNRMLNDYARAYRDILDNDPNSRSYMDFFPSTFKEEDLDTAWLTRILKSRRDFYRRNRDLSIIGAVALYLLCAVDAYVDASLAHFDVSPNLSLDLTPTALEGQKSGIPVFGLQWSLRF